MCVLSRGLGLVGCKEVSGRNNIFFNNNVWYKDAGCRVLSAVNVALEKYGWNGSRAGE